MTVHYVTTGMSLWTHARCWRGCAVDVAALDGKRNDDLGWEDSGLLKQARAEVFGFLGPRPSADRARETARLYFRSDAWDPLTGYLLSAELNTLAAMKAKGVIRRGDIIRLIRGSDGQEVMGVTNLDVCALLAAILREQTEDDGPLAGVEIELTEPFDWDPFDDDKFRAGMKRLWGEISSAREDGPLSLVLTGGYKAVLISLAISLGGAPMDAKVYYMYDGADAGLVTLDVVCSEIVGSHRDRA